MPTKAHNATHRLNEASNRREQMQLGTATLQQQPCASDFSPRTDTTMADRLDIETDMACELMGRACRAFIDGNPMSARACADLLRDAAEMLVSLASEVEA